MQAVFFSSLQLLGIRAGGQRAGYLACGWEGGRPPPLTRQRPGGNNSRQAWQPPRWTCLGGGSPQLHISGQTLTKIETQIGRKITGWNLQTYSGAVLWTENRSQSLY